MLGLDGIVAELVARLRVQQGQPVDVSPADVRGWLPDAAEALLAAGMLIPGTPAISVVCDGCEEACSRPVQVMPNGDGGAVAFVLCHLREDIDRIVIPSSEQERWRFTMGSLASGLATLIANGRATASEEDRGYRLGVVEGRNQDRWILRLSDDDGPRLTLAGHVLAPQDILVLVGNRLSVDMRMLMRCANAPGDVTSVPTESSDVIGKRMLARKRELKAGGVKAFLRIIAEEEGCSTSWVKQLIAKASEPNPFAALTSPADSKATVSGRSKRPR